MIAEFLQFQTALRLYHWNTRSYARHIASGELYKALDTLIDRFVEVAQGESARNRISYKTFEIVGTKLTDAQMVKVIRKFALFLQKMKPLTDDLKNLRDEMMNHVSQTLYLFTLI